MNSVILDWIKIIKKDHPKLFFKNRVIEFGALDINGSPRSIFEQSVEYIGVDAQVGEGVDKRALCHHYQDEEKFDVVISTEMLEHDPYWDLSFKNMVDLVKIGGSFITTFAGPNRHAHGQEKYTPLNHYYRNISTIDIFPLIAQYQFKEIYLKNKDNDFLSLFCHQKF